MPHNEKKIENAPRGSGRIKRFLILMAVEIVVVVIIFVFVQVFKTH